MGVLPHCVGHARIYFNGSVTCSCVTAVTQAQEKNDHIHKTVGESDVGSTPQHPRKRLNDYYQRP